MSSNRANLAARAPRARVATLVAALAATLVLGLLVATPQGAQAAPKNLFGVLPHFALDDRDFRVLSRNNLNVTRFNLEWRLVQERHMGSYDWRYFDRFVRSGARHGVRTMPLLFGTPEFISDSWVEPPIHSEEAKWGWWMFVASAVERYGPRGEFWQGRNDIPHRPIRQWFVWNEPNLSTFFQPRADAREYTELLRWTSHAIRTVDPGAQVIVSGLQGLGDNPPIRISADRYLQQLYDLGARQYFDVIDVHPYARNRKGVGHQMDVMRRVMNRNGDHAAEMMVSEIGWSTGSSTGERSMVTTNIQGQARNLRQTLRMFKRHRARWNLRHVLWFTYQDHPNPQCFWCGGAGLLHQDGSPKPAWRELRRIANGRG